MRIRNITSRKLMASLGNETIEATVEFEDGSKSSASIPAGVSTGKYEVKKVSADVALLEIGKINDLCKNKELTQSELDTMISGQGFGGNSTLAVSAACWRVQPDVVTKIQGPAKKFPKLMLLLFEGGEHGNRNLTMQEFMVIEDSYVQAAKDFRTIRESLEQNRIEKTVGAEGGFSPLKFNNPDALETIKKVLPDKSIAIDVAGDFNPGEFFDYSALTYYYPIKSIEDPYTDEDWEQWAALISLLGRDIMVVGDDLTVTNPERIKMAISKKACDAVIIKPNQIGTISGALEAVRVAKEGGLKIIVSHRGEETDDNWIVDFAIFVDADYVKFGGMERGERIAKYNRLMELGMR